ncbi:MAG TPA: AAA family ATPase [Stellaceae bacterium]|nr:AAA family ATPase [Stellaceae bacterium]
MDQVNYGRPPVTNVAQCEDGPLLYRMDFNPLGKVVLPDIGPVPCSGLTLVVGPNSSGKTQFLNDIFLRLSGQPRTLVVASEVVVNKPPQHAAFVEALIANGYLRKSTDTNNREQLVPRTTYVGTGEAVPPIDPQQAENWYQTAPAPGQRNEYFAYFMRLLVTRLSLERRLANPASVNLIDFATQPPQSDLHAFYVNCVAQQQLSSESIEVFGKAVWPDLTRGNMLCLRVADGKLPAADDRLSFERMETYRLIDTEGDGLKSYVAICMALLLGRRPVCLIDEPEMCLHPPQAYALGRFIATHASSKNIATFVATHSSQVLRGVVQSTEHVEIIRLSRAGGKFAAHRIPANELVTALKKPSLLAETVLDGIFSEAVLVVEADGDRLVYQTTWQTLSDEFRLDIHFTAVGGMGGIADTCSLYRTLDIPVAVIADLDIIVDPDKLDRILHSMDTAEVDRPIVECAKALAEEIRKLPPTIDEAAYKDRLSKISEVEPNWSSDKDISIRRDLRALSDDLDRMRRLKSGDMTTFPEPIKSQLMQVVDALKKSGIFLVPVGELEGWLAAYDVGVSKTKKQAWAYAAAVKIRSIGSRSVDIWQFMRDVGSYLANRNT